MLTYNIYSFLFSTLSDIVRMGCGISFQAWCRCASSAIGFISIFSGGETWLLSRLQNCLNVLHHPRLASISFTCLVLIMYVPGWITLNKTVSNTQIATRFHEFFGQTSKVKSIQMSTPAKNSTIQDRIFVCKPIMFARRLRCWEASSKAWMTFLAFAFLFCNHKWLFKLNFIRYEI